MIFKFKKILFLYFCTSALCFTVNAQLLEPPIPFGAELIDKKENKKEQSLIYLYRSKASMEEVLEYYRGAFVQQGFKEQKLNNTSNPDIFINNKEKTIILLVFPPSLNEQETAYSLTIGKMAETTISKEQLASSLSNFSNNIRDPQKLDFMPVYPNAKQFEYGTWEASLSVGVAYVSHDSAEAIEKFYLDEMPSYQWDLVDREPSQGAYNFSEWFSKIAPYSQFCSKCNSSLMQDEFLGIPPLTIKGSKLTFAADGKKCVITIYTFQDIIEKAQGTMYDLSFMKQYGNTIIGIVYFYNQNE